MSSAFYLFEIAMQTIQKTITRKADLRPLIANLKTLYLAQDDAGFWQLLESEILQHRVKFPLLEFVARELVQFIPQDKQLDFTDTLVTKTYEGQYVILGIVLQERLVTDMAQSFAKAEEYIIYGDKWYACDIISERVFGVGLLQDFDTAVSHIQTNIAHPNPWIVRSAGIATHYATYKGLAKEKVVVLFEMLLPAAQSKDKNIKKGVGWAFKTIAKHHPDIVQPRLDTIQNDPAINNWCKQKLVIGLQTAQKNG